MGAYDGVLRKVIKDKSGNNVAFVIQDRQNQLFQLNKETVKRYMDKRYSGAKNIAGLDLSSDNRLIVKKDRDCDIEMIELVPNEILLHRDEYKRVVEDWLVENKYKGMKRNVGYKLRGTTNSVNISHFEMFDTIALHVEHKTKINFWEEDAINYIKYFRKLVPACYQNDGYFAECYYNKEYVMGRITRALMGNRSDWIGMCYIFDIHSVGCEDSSLVYNGDKEYYKGRQVVELKRLIGTN